MVDTITTNADGSATINREDGGSHTVDATTEGLSATEILQETYPDSVMSTAEDTDTTSEIPEKPVVPSYTEDDVVGRKLGGGFFGRGDKSSYVTLSDGTRFSSKKGGTFSEIADAKAKADAYIAQQQTLLDEWNEKYGTTATTEINQSAIEAAISDGLTLEEAISSGAGIGSLDSNLVDNVLWWVENDNEQLLATTTNFVPTAQVIADKILKNASDEVKQQVLGIGRNIDSTEEEYREYENNKLLNFAQNILDDLQSKNNSNFVSFHSLMAIGGISADAFIQATGVANTQISGLSTNYSTLETGQGYIVDGAQTIGDGSQYVSGYGIDPLSITLNDTEFKPTGDGLLPGIQRASFTLSGSNYSNEQIDYNTLLNNYYIKPEDIQGADDGMSGYQNYYNKFKAGYEFLTDSNFIITPKATKVSLFNTQETGTETTGVDQSGITATPDVIPDTTQTQVQTTPTVTYPSTSTYLPQDQSTATTTTDLSQTSLGTGTTIPQSDVSGTFNVGSQTAGLGAVPTTVTTATNPTGTTLANLTGATQGIATGASPGVNVVPYTNSLGMTQMVTEINGQPMAGSYIPPGYTKAVALNRGGEVKLAKTLLGFKGQDSELDNFLNTNPAAANRMNMYRQEMNRMGFNPGGVVSGYQDSSDVTQDTTSGIADRAAAEAVEQQQRMLRQGTMNLPSAAPVQYILPQAADFVAPTAGQAAPISTMAQSATQPTVAQAGMVQTIPSQTFSPQTYTGQITEATGQIAPVTGNINERSILQAQQAAGTAVSGLDAATGEARTVQEVTPTLATRTVDLGTATTPSELIEGGVADQRTASGITEAVPAATAIPTAQATVQGQLINLMRQFEGGETPAWAAGAIRFATAKMIDRGIGASSIAGQAIVQAAMESALPIAQADAQVQAQFEAQNLSNRQQRAILSAQQRAEFLQLEFTQDFQARVQNAARISDIANANFSSDQQIALENSRAANTMDLNNLSNRQAKVMAEAAALTQLDISNLNNRQAAAVQEAQAFLNLDMTDLANEQQTELFKNQQNIQSLFTDQAAVNAAEQFNAANENQTNQFFSSLATQVSQYNASQQNATDQFNVSQVNALRKFNAEVQNQREAFNAQNGLIVAQSNAKWRQNLATLNTQQINEANKEYVSVMNQLTAKNLDEIWQKERDLLSFVWRSAEGNADRARDIVVQKIAADATVDAAKLEAKVAATSAIGSAGIDLIASVLNGNLFSNKSN